MLKSMMLSIAVSLLPGVYGTSTDDPATIDRVEEDWEVVVATTDADAAGPQLTTTMCPGAVSDHPSINFNLNYRDKPSFLAGGLQVQAWDSSNLIGYVSSKSEQLDTDNETISWTQRLKLSGGSIEYRIISGTSETWGEFGGDDLAITFDVALDSLSSYSPDTSLLKSGVGWQSDHVTMMRLVRIRYYSGETLVFTDDTERIVHSDD